MSFFKKINVDKLLQISNRPSPPSERNFAVDTENLKKICELYLNNKGVTFLNSDVYVISNYIWKGFPPKTKRIIFRENNKIKCKADITNIISQIEPIENEKNLFRVKIVNKISLKEWEIFQKKLSKIEELKFKSEKIATSDDDIKKLSISLSIIDNVDSDFMLEQSYQIDSCVFSMIALEESVKENIKDRYKIEHIDDNEYLDMNLSNDKKNIKLFLNEFGMFVISVCSATSNRPMIDISDDKTFENFVLNFSLPKPNFNDVTIGVIDTGFKVPEVFEPWVENNETFVAENKREIRHGTTVSSLIIANDELNETKDGFGNFKVKHFELLDNSAVNINAQYDDSIFDLFKNIRAIIDKNYKQIKIWNISFTIGMVDKSSSISYFARFLDKISYKYNVLFIVSSGNYGDNSLENSLGGGSDGMNSLSVGAVEWKNNKIVKSSYSSIGFSGFLVKPDIATYGGKIDLNGKYFKSYDGSTKIEIEGTSYSAPLVSRLAGFLYRNGMSINQIRCRILNKSKRMTNSIKASSFGYIDIWKKEMNCFMLDGELSNNLPSILKVKLPKTRKLSISISFMVDPANQELSEYCYNSLDFGLYYNMTDDSIDTGKNFYSKCKPLKTTAEDYNKFRDEKHQRQRDGKYSTIWKKQYEISEDLISEEYFIYVRLLNLHTNFFNDETVKYSLEIFFEDFDDAELILKDNEEITEADITVSVDNVD